MPTSCAGIPAVARRMICGGVRTDSRERDAPPSARSVAISAPELPATTRTSQPRYGAGLQYRRWTTRRRSRRGRANRGSTARRCSRSRRSPSRRKRPVREGQRPAVPSARSARARAGAHVEPLRLRVVAEIREGRRATPSVVRAGSAAPAVRRAASACAGAAGRSARATRRPAPARPRARAVAAARRQQRRRRQARRAGADDHDLMRLPVRVLPSVDGRGPFERTLRLLVPEETQQIDGEDGEEDDRLLDRHRHAGDLLVGERRRPPASGRVLRRKSRRASERARAAARAAMRARTPRRGRAPSVRRSTRRG